MLLFPFTNKDGFDLVEFVLLPEIPIWANKAEERALLNRHLLVVMLLLCGGRGKGDAIDYTQYKSQYPSEGTKKAVIKESIQTVWENMSELLQKAERELQEERKEAKRKLQEEREEAERKLQEVRKEAERKLQEERKSMHLFASRCNSVH